MDGVDASVRERVGAEGWGLEAAKGLAKVWTQSVSVGQKFVPHARQGMGVVDS